MKLNRTKLFLLLALMGVSIFSCEEDPDGPAGNSLDQVAGEWVRVLSNNPSSDGMELTVVGNTGTITEKAGSNFKVGDVKWNDIVPSDITDYEYQELGSDYNYYSATMNLETDTVYLSVASSGAGNVQKWVRKSKYTKPEPSAETIVLECKNISTETVFVNGPAAIDYLIPRGCVLDVTESLTIEPGTVIAMEENAGIGVYDAGSLTAIGTSAEPIRIQGAQNIRGLWRGIHIETKSIRNQLDFVEISEAGSNYVYCCNDVGSLFLKKAKIGIKNSKISNGEGIGLLVAPGTEISAYEKNQITSHKEYPVSISMEDASQLDGLGSDYAGNEKEFVLLKEAQVSNPSTLKKINIPYLTENKVYDVVERLSVEAGVEIVFAENAGLGIYNNGALTISGTNAEAVVFRGAQNVTGYWRGIHIETNTLNNDINYLELSNAGANYVYCCNGIGSIFLKDGKASIKNSTISEGAGYGILTKTGFVFSGFENNRITTHAEEPLFLSMVQAGQLDGMASDFSGNTKDYVRIYDANVNTSTSIPKNNVPYSIETGKVIDVTEPLTLAPGVDIVFEAQAGLGIYDNASLNAVGTSSERITFRGRSEAKGSWRGIHTETASLNNVLDFVSIKHAGSNYVYCCNTIAGLFVKKGNMTLTNSEIEDNAGCGVFAGSNATLTESSNTFSNNTEGDICN